MALWQNYIYHSEHAQQRVKLEHTQFKCRILEEVKIFHLSLMKLFYILFKMSYYYLFYILYYFLNT